MKSLSLFSLVLGTALVASTAHASSKVIKYNDLDLTTEKDKAELDRRIEAVAKLICSDQPRTGTRLMSDAAMRACIREVRAEVMAKIPAQG